MDPQELDAWFVEYDRLSAAIDPYMRVILAKLGSWYDGCGKPLPLTEEEHTFERVNYYWQAGLINAGDVFGYMHFIIEHKTHFKAIGAKRTLKAMRQLMHYYEEQKEIKTEEEQWEYWRRTRELRAPLEEQAEDVLEFGQLLLAFAERNLEYLKHPNEP